MVWNWAGTLAEAATAFVLAPFLVKHLGEHDYGLWILLGSMASYMGLIDLGVRGSVGRYLAFYRGQGDREAIRGIFKSGLQLSTGAAVFILVLALALERAFMGLFDISPEAAPHVRLALWLVVANLACSMPLSLFDAVLWGAQRFDRVNQIGIPAALLRLAASYWVVREGYGLVGLAASTLSFTLLVGAARLAAALQVEPAAFSRRIVGAQGMAGTLFRYGLPMFAMSISRMTRMQLVPAVIGWSLGPAWVTHYSLSRRLVDYAEAFLVSLTGVFTPAFASLQAQGDGGRQVYLVTVGGRLSAAMGLLFAGFALMLGGPFLGLWLGGAWVAYAPLLWILAIGEVLPFSQAITGNMLLGVARHRALAILLVAEVAVIAAGVIVVSRPFGVRGICLVLAVAGTIFRGILVMGLGCRALKMPVLKYVWEALVPALAACSVPVAGLAILVSHNPPSTWPRFLIDLVAYGLLTLPALVALGAPTIVRLVRSKVS